jgi:DNA-directed RNA polymerase subunit RPC12/RpoP
MVKLPIRCHACGQEGLASLDQVMATGACACGSDDIEVDDLEATAAWESDPPMDTLHNTNVVSQTARCSNCFTEFQVSATDPAQPMPNCPECGSSAVSAAGATNTHATGSKTAVAGNWVIIGRDDRGYVAIGPYTDSNETWEAAARLGQTWYPVILQPPGSYRFSSLTAEAEAQPTPMQCNECGRSFKKKIGPRTVEVRCPKCGGYDTEPKYASKLGFGLMHVEHSPEGSWDVVMGGGEVVRSFFSEDQADSYVEAHDAAHGPVGDLSEFGRYSSLEVEADLPGAGGIGFGGFAAGVAGAINAARNGSDREKIPGWFMKFFKRLLLPEEIASGYFVHSEGGGSLEGAFAAKGDPAHPEDYRPGQVEAATYRYTCSQCGTRMRPESGLQGMTDWKCPKCGHVATGSEKANATRTSAMDPKTAGEAPVQCPNCNGRMKPMYGDERGDYRCVQCGTTVDRSKVTYDENLQRRRTSAMDPITAKVIEITTSITAANPGLPKREAVRVAEQVIARYPNMVQKRSA